MNWKRALLIVVLAVFSLMTAEALWEHGYLGFVDRVMANSATRLAMVDLVIALALILIWMVEDGRAKKPSLVFYILLTVAFGSAGPLLYLIRRPGPRREAGTTARLAST
jgi:hypothetical protein